jgi:hypothetical protein
MRNTLLVGLLSMVITVHLQGQTLAPAPSRPLFAQATSLASEAATSRQPVSLQPPRRIHYCCNRKHALIGAAIGAAIGLGYATLCDAGSCTSTYIKYALVAGGIGAGLGAFVSAKPAIAPPPSFASP